MAVFTPLSRSEASAAAAAHGLSSVDHVTPIPAGSVNSNFFVDADGERFFFRIYEEQETEGVAYEWALLDHLAQAGLPVPTRISGGSDGPKPGAVRVAGKPIALFALVGGDESCQRGVTVARAARVGRFLATAHEAVQSFSWRREGRFTRADVRKRLDAAAGHGRSELVSPIARLRAALDEVDAADLSRLPRRVIHGDLFRDNVRWEGDEIVAVIDWESASDGELAYDLMVTVLAWCYGDDFDWDLARALVRAYDGARPLGDAEWEALRVVGMGAAARFAATRITDFHLREGIGERVQKDYRRFVARLESLAALSADEVAMRLGYGEPA